MVKKGDTLVEVLLAVGIFSMIAISVVAVMSGGTSSAQTALETTLTREEIDAQAEALRFIHDAYVNERDSDNTSRSAISLWQKIVGSAYVPNGDSEDEAFLQYNPKSCSTEEYPGNAFILDTRNLDKGADAFYSGQGVFAKTSTYPQLRFKDIKNDEEVNNNTLVTEDKATELASAEGIYVVAVADKDTTTVLDIDGNPVAKKGDTDQPAFYDFYIRSCWYGTDSDTPSTISTVIRLHNPDIKTEYYSFSARFWSNNVEVGKVEETHQIEFKNHIPPQIPNYIFKGWCSAQIGLGEECGENNKTYTETDSFYNTDRLTSNYDFYAIWERQTYQVNFHSNTGDGSMSSQTINVGERTRLKGNEFKKANFAFQGWSETNNGEVKKYEDQDWVTDIKGSGEILDLYAIWKPVDYYVDVNPVVDRLTYASGFSFRDFFAQTVGIDSQLEQILSHYTDQRISSIFFDLLEDPMCYNVAWRSNQEFFRNNDPANGTVLLSFRDYLGILLQVHKDILQDHNYRDKKTFTFDVYVNDKLVADNVKDYYEPLPYGSKVEVRPNNTPGFDTPGSVTKTVNGNITFSPKWRLKFYQVEIYPVVNGISRPYSSYRFKVKMSSFSQNRHCPYDYFYDGYYRTSDSPIDYFHKSLPYGTKVQVYIDYDSTSYTSRSCLKHEIRSVYLPGWGPIGNSETIYYYRSPYTKTEFDQSWIVRDNLVIKPQWSCLSPY